MTQKKVIVCDSCGKEAEEGKTEGYWFSVGVIIGNRRLMENLQEKMREDPEGDLTKLLDNGEFCSLDCLSGWATATANLRGLDIELGEVG